MNKTTIAIIAAVLLALYAGVSALTGTVKDETAPPPQIENPIGEQPPVGLPKVEEKADEEVPADLPSDPAARINRCNEVIETYRRLKFEKNVLGNDYITPQLERQYRECT